MTISEKMARFVCGVRYNKLPSEVIDMAKRCILDWLGSAYAGGVHIPPKKILKVAEKFGGKKQATIIPGGNKSSVLLAAFVNGGASHFVELDDLHRDSILHPAAPIISCAVAVAEAEKLSGKKLIESVVSGYEIGIRVGEAVGPDHYLRWHTTGTCGTFGSAAAAGKLLSLSVEDMVYNMGNAGSQAAGLWEFLTNASMTKQLHTGKAAMNGVLSAYLSKEGFTGAKTIFEGEKGFCRATSNKYNLDKLTEKLGSEYKMLRNSFKVHATCRHIHSSIDAVLEIVKKYHPDLEDITSVKVRLYDSAMDLLEKKAVQPKDTFEARFSIPFCLSTALVYGSVGLEAFTKERLKNSRIKKLASRVKIFRDKSLNRYYPERWPAVVSLITGNSRIFEKRIDFPKGDSENPLSLDELIQKFINMTDGIISRRQTDIFIQKILNIENQRMDKFFV